MEKLGKTKLGRSYLNNIVINLVKKYGGETVEIYGERSTINPKTKIIREELKELYRRRDIKGVDYIQALRNIIFKHFDYDTANKIDRELMIRINLLELGRKGIVDFIDGRTFYKTDSKQINFKEFDLKKIHEAISLARIKKSKKDYFEMKIARLMVESIRKANSPEELAIIFEKLYMEEREKDPVFKASEFNAALSFIVEMYNKSALVGIPQQVLLTVPSRLVKLASRMLAQAYRMIPIVGAIASTQVEAAGAVAEIGEAISRKVESSAYMYYNLRDILGDRIPLSQLLEDQIRRTQINA